MSNSATNTAARARRPWLTPWLLAALLTTSCSPALDASEAFSAPTITADALETPVAPTTTAPSTGRESAEPTLSPPPAVSPAPRPPVDTAAGAADVPVAAPVWLTIGTAKMDMPILPLAPTSADLASQSLIPPLTEDAYWLTNYGKPGTGSQNTTYITGHSWTDKDAPFNRLSTLVKVGDPISLGTETGTLNYVVDSVTTHDKDTLKNSDIWDIVPNRLVLISCFTEDPWGKNVVVTAVPA